jgi:uncharacterized protein YaiI (UPF0178 family)
LEKIRPSITERNFYYQEGFRDIHVPLTACIAFALNPKGKLYTEENIKDCLVVQDLLSELQDGGLMTGGPPAFRKKEL